MIVIVADDLGYADVGFHGMVADEVDTPNLDRLARSGVVFKNAYASSPICSNSRLALSTGRYQQRWGAYYYGDGGLPTTENTIAEMMREAGYRTMKVGKTHLNFGPKEHPMNHGFDAYLGFEQHSWDFNLLSHKDVEAYERKMKGSVAIASRKIGIGPLTRNREGKASFENTTTTEVFGRESLSFINASSEKPFYLQLEFNAVHTPLYRLPKQLADKHGVPERPFDRNAAVWEFPHWDPIAQPDHNQWYSDTCHLVVPDPYGRKIYLGHLELMDTVIGKILDTLEDRQIAGNTIVFFTSDNGGSHQSYANNGDLNAFKYCLMDGGIKVPMLLSWPDKFKANTKISAVVTHRDLFASLSEIIRIAPKNPLDGKSLLPLVEGTVADLHDDETLFWDSGERQMNWVARQGDWKLVYRKEAAEYQAYQLDEAGLVSPEFKTFSIPTGLQLYNLREDPGETKDLSQAYPEKVASLKKEYDSWRSQMSDRIRGRDAL